ncbi:MFS transporter [Streptomyces sp. NBC_00273]|uniref:MFS transporter n=1 Tax=Streptomyces sp. NBC_00273 TaxID=2903644 RepID=UPI002E2DCCC6|nr:MFS transporter [Streptomyces sp. NBC_00273]
MTLPRPRPRPSAGEKVPRLGPGFRWYLSGESAGLVGTSVHLVALPTLAVLELDATAGQAALLASLAHLPTFLLALPAGGIVDRYAKRALLVGTDLAGTAVVMVVPVAALAGMLSMPVLYAVALVLGAVTVLHQAAAIAIVPQLVEPALLHRANARVGAAFGAADTAGTYLGTAVVAVVGASRAFWLDALSYLVSACCATRLPEPGRPVRGKGRSGRRLAGEIGEGLAYTARTPLVRDLVLALTLTGVGVGVTGALFAYYVLTALEAGPTGLGIVMGVSGVGALVGALAAPRIVARFGPGPTLLAGFATCPVAGVPLLVAGPGPVWLVVLAAAGGLQLAAAAVAGTTQRSVRQQICPPGLQARAQQTSTWLVSGSKPFAALAGGAVATAYGARAALAVGTLVLVLPVVVLWRSPVSRLTAMPVPAPPADGSVLVGPDRPPADTDGADPHP